jgi:TolB-like protein
MRVLKQAVIAMLTFLIASPAFAEQKSAPRQKTLIVFNIIAERGVDAGLTNILSEVAIDRSASKRVVKVIGQKDVDKMLSWEQSKQLKGCTDTQCLVQIAGALGADYYLEGSLGVVGEKYFLTLKLIDSMSVEVLDRYTKPVKMDETALVEMVKEMIDALFGKLKPENKEKPVSAPVAAEKGGQGGKVEQKVEKPTYPMNPYKLAGHATFWPGLALAGLGGAFTALASKSADQYGRTLEGKGDVSLYNGLAVTGYALGGAAIVAGIVLWALSPGDEAWAKKHKVSVAPSCDPSGCGLSVGGAW